jgi:ubiquitin carboxyl-terminal hydrolase 8
VLIQLFVDRTALAPMRLIKAVYETLDLVPREQQDFSELWMRLISQMMEESHDEDTVCGHLSVAQWSGGNRVTKHIGKLALRAWENYTKNNKSMLIDLCHGTQVQQIKCLECGKTYHNVEPIVSTYVELGDGRLGSCLERLHVAECINDWTCDACGKKRAERVLRFWNLGEVWVIILKRFDHEKKISVPVDIMNRFEIGVMEFDQPVAYELCAMANHFGSLHGGHYTAVCKGERGVWYHVDDTGVAEVEDIGRVLRGNRDAYALFYQRIS